MSSCCPQTIMAEETTYSEITDFQERLMLFNIYVVGSMEILLSIQMLYSLIKMYRKHNLDQDGYYIYGIMFGITLTVSSTLFFLIRLLSNDLILPIDQLYTNHVNLNIVSLIGCVIVLLWLMIKISLYFGFTFIYLSVFEKEKIDLCLRILMTFIGLCTMIYMIEYIISDLTSESLSKICRTQTRGVYMVNVIIIYNSANSVSIYLMLTAFVAFITDFVFIFTLLYRFIANATIAEKYYFQGIKGCVLICISSIVPISTAIIAILGLNTQYLMALGDIQVIIDIILFVPNV